MNKNLTLEPSNISDEKIIELYWERDETAIKHTDEKYGRFLHGIAYNILHDTLDCEECQNDTYLELWKAIPPTKPVAFKAFITQIMRRTAIDRYYKNSERRKIPSELTVSMDECEYFVSNDETPDEIIFAQELGSFISDFVRNLPEKQQYIFMGRFYLADPVATIARELQVTESSVYKALSKLKRDLKKELLSKEVTI